VTLVFLSPSHPLSFFLSFILVVVLGLELRTSHLLVRHCTWEIPPDLFALVIFEIGSCCLPRPAWTAILLFYASYHSWNYRHMLPCPGFFLIEMGSCSFFCPGLSRTMILMISASQVATIAGLCYLHLAVILVFLVWLGLSNRVISSSIQFPANNISFFFLSVY
jgi:hypothetical protein